MKTLISFILCLIPTSALASTSIVPSETNLLMWGFLGFSALILLVQCLPATIMFISMVKGLFTSNENLTVRGH